MKPIIKERGGSKLKSVRKSAVQITLLVCGIVMLCFGAWRGEAETVLGKAIRLCLECVGIG